MSKVIADVASTRKRMREEAVEVRKPAKKVVENPNSNIIYVGHIPKGFFENEMTKFFSQFGDVKKVKLFRSLKTGNSKGYGFVMFESTETAEVVAGTLNGYLVNDKKLTCNVIPKAEVHEGMFLSRKIAEAPQTQTAPVQTLTEAIVKRTKSKLSKKAKKLEALGIEYDVYLSNSVSENNKAANNTTTTSTTDKKAVKGKGKKKV